MAPRDSLAPTSHRDRNTTDTLWSLALIIVGGGLWLFAGDVALPIVTPTKVGVVLVVIGAAGLLGVALRRSRRRPR